MLTPLLAIAAVAAIPPKKGITVLTTPWEISSRLLLCFVPVIPSHTTAQSNASIDPSKAIVAAAGRIFFTNSQEKCGIVIEGNPWGISPTKGMFRVKKTAKTVNKINATMEAGIFLVYLLFANSLGSKTNKIIVPIVIPKEAAIVPEI